MRGNDFSLEGRRTSTYLKREGSLFAPVPWNVVKGHEREVTAGVTQIWNIFCREKPYLDTRIHIPKQ